LRLSAVKRLQEEDPEAFEELSLKSKWSYIVKDPEKAQRDQAVQNVTYISDWGIGVLEYFEPPA